MIGQKRLKRYIKALLEEGTFPRFAILVGQTGSGKKTLLKEFFPDAIYLEDSKIDSVRRLIDMAYKLNDKIFVLPDADSMSNGAKNALLKVVEECPNNNRFIMTLEDEVNTLVTIRSRAQIFYMDMYFPKDIKEYASTIDITDEKELEVVEDVCETPGDVNTLKSSGIKDFYDYTNLVLDNIADVSLANALKIPNKIAVKADDAGFDLKLFLRMFMELCIRKNKGNVDWVMHTSKCLISLRTKAINKAMLLDKWIFEIRGVI